MNMAVRQLQPFGAEVRGLDLAAPNEVLRAQVEALMDEFAVIVLPDQAIDANQQVAFSRLFGTLECPPAARGNRGERNYGLPPEIFPITNLRPDGTFEPEDDAARQYRLANALWHTDSSFRQTGATYSLLYANEVPPFGADTEFTDMRNVYDELSESVKAQLDDFVAEHSVWHSRGQLGGYKPTPEEIAARPPARHPLVRINPNTGRKGLYIAAHVSHIVGLAAEESRLLLNQLMDFATQRHFVYAHKWRVHDMVIWDNRFTMHRATDFEDMAYKRDLRRTTVREFNGPIA